MLDEMAQWNALEKLLSTIAGCFSIFMCLLYTFWKPIQKYDKFWKNFTGSSSIISEECGGTGRYINPKLNIDF